MSWIKQLKKTLDFLLFGNIFIGAGASCQVLLTGLLLGFHSGWLVPVFVFLATVGVYNFSVVSFSGAATGDSGSRRDLFVASHSRELKLVMLACLASLAVLAFRLKPLSLLVLAIPGLCCILYSVAFFSFRGKRLSLRKIPGAKLIVIALVWSVSTVWLPVIESGALIPSHSLWIWMLKRFLFTAAACICFDMKDIFNDRTEGLQTIPGVLGLARAKLICMAMLASYLILAGEAHSGISENLFTGIALACLLELPIVWLSDEKRSDYFFFICIDGLFVMQYLVVLAFA